MIPDRMLLLIQQQLGTIQRGKRIREEESRGASFRKTLFPYSVRLLLVIKVFLRWSLMRRRRLGGKGFTLFFFFFLFIFFFFFPNRKWGVFPRWKLHNGRSARRAARSVFVRALQLTLSRWPFPRATGQPAQLSEHHQGCFFSLLFPFSSLLSLYTVR